MSGGEKRNSRCWGAIAGLAPRLRDGLDQIVESNEGPSDSRGHFPDHSTPDARAHHLRACGEETARQSEGRRVHDIAQLRLREKLRE